MSEDKKQYKYEIPLDGKLITRDPPARIGANFQQLTNMRYAHGGKGIKGVGGMSKINSAVMNATYLKTRSGIHFKKDQPSESHVLAEAFNTGETESRIWQNTTAIPSTGNFSATSLYSPSTSASGAGVFSMAPDGDVAYCNGEESCIWGGAEREVAGFINYDPDGTFSYDFTEEVRNTKTDSLNIASLTSRSSGQDGNAKLLMHFDNNYTDTIGTHSPNANNTPTFTTSSKFGTHAVVMNGSVGNQYINISDHADFDFSGGTFTIDCWLFKASSDAAYTHTIWYQRTTNDNDSFKFYADENGALIVTIKAGGTKQFSGATDFKTANGVVGADWRHVELVESGNNWYIFVDGELKAYTSDAARAANYTGDVWIGYDGSEYILARLDELRISDSARHTTSFEPLSEAYSTDSTQTAMYIGSVRPLDGFKLYIGTANTSASSMSAFYWDGSTWAAVSSLTDNTDTGASLAQTGTVTFTSTASTAKIKYIDGVLVYWYKVVVDALSAGTTITHVTASAPFQEIVDIWDGMPRPIDSFQIYDASKYSEATINVRENEYNASDAGTFISVPQLATGSDYVICGFIERMTGVVFNFVSATENTVSGTVVSVDYWDGSDWATVGTVDDGTVENNVSWGKTGAMTWDAPASSSEFTQSISNDVKLYYYKFSFSKSITDTPDIYFISGIAVQKKISAYNIPGFANNRLWLLANEKGKKNSALCSADGTSSVFNGDDSLSFEFGDETDLTGMAWLFSSVGSSLYNVMIFFKKNETWALIGDNLEEWTSGKYRVSSVIGCVAPETIQVIDIGPQQAQTLNRNIVVWQAHDGIYMSDGRSPIKISSEIDDKFDQRQSTSINTAMIHKSTATWDKYNKCYHWFWASGSSTTINEEYVFDFEKAAWFQIDRGTGKDLQYAIDVTDTTGNSYNYGFIDTGYMERLENGNAFDGGTIAQTFHLGDIAPTEGSVTVETDINYICLINNAKSTTSSSITITHYGDGESSGTSWTESPKKSSYDITMPVEHRKLGSHVFHSIKATISTDDEIIGFEPIFIYFLYSPVRDHLTDWR